MLMSTGKSNLIFYVLIGATVLLIFISNPFMKLPYDIWEHLNRIAGLHDEGVCFEFYPEKPSFMCFWHSLWAGVFKTTGINDVFIWAKIIHVVQFLLSFAAVFYFCKTVIKLFLSGIETTHLKYLSFFGVCLWYIGNGTFSIAYQQAWIMWYSVSYQGLSVPLLWYITALMLKTAYESPSFKRSIFYLSQIAILSVLMAKIHPSELLYFILLLFLLLAINPKKSFGLLKKYYYIAVPSVLIVAVAIKHFAGELVPSYVLPNSKENIRLIAQQIMVDGSHVVDGGLNRFPDSFSEIAAGSLLFALIFRTFYFFKRDRVPDLNIKVFDYILAASLLFLLIPLNRITAGTAVYVLTKPPIIWRFVFGSPWFVLLPVLIYTAFRYFSEKPELGELVSACVIVTLVFVYSSNYIFWGALHKNTNSIFHSLNKDRVGVQYSESDISALEARIMKTGPDEDLKPGLYYIRGDSASLVRGIFRKYVYLDDRRDPQPTRSSFFNKGLDRKYKLVEIGPPDK